MTIENFNLPVGRIVSGNPASKQQKTNFTTGQPVIGKDGQPVFQWRCEIAYSKDVFLREIYPYLLQEVTTMYPINPQTGQPNVNRDFSWKYVDGDSPECPKNSKLAYNQREGFQGCYVLKLSTEAFAPKISKWENGGWRTLEENEIKCGDYVVANVTIRAHNSSDGGLYINPNGYSLVGYGSEIRSQGGSDPTKMFGQNPQYQLPAGASLMPVSSAPVSVGMPVAGNMPQQPPMGSYNPPAPQPYGVPQPMAAPMTQMPPPAYDLVQGQPLSANPAGMMPQQPPMGMQPSPQFSAPVAGNMPQQPPMGLQAGGYAQPATGYPSNGMPNLPQR